MLIYTEEHFFKIRSLKGGSLGSSESTLVKCHIVGNHMSHLTHSFFSIFSIHMWVSDPVALVIECPVETLFTASSLWVIEVEGTVTNALLMSTYLTCRSVKGVTILH